MSFCECPGDVETPQFMVDSHPAARKEHRCCECGKTINPGDRYERVTGMWDGIFQTFATCEFCAKVRRDLSAAGFCVTMEQLWESVKNIEEDAA